MSNDLRGLVLGDYRHRVRHAPGVLGWAKVTPFAPPPPPPPPPPSEPAVAGVSFLNTDSVATDTHWITQPIGWTFKKGDIPAGQYPLFKIGATTIPYTYWGRNEHDDGSWRFCGLIFRIPTALSAGGNTTIDSVTATATPPSAPSVSLTDAYAENIDVRVTGALNISGEWIATLDSSNATAAGDIWDWTDDTNDRGGGDVAKVYTVGIPFKQSGSEHAGLYCWFHLFILQDDAGGLHDIRVLPMVARPWVNKSGDTDYGWLVFEDVELRLNGVVVKTPARAETSFEFTHETYGSAKTITGITNAADRPTVSAAAHGFTDGQWVSIVGVSGMTEVNGRVYEVIEATTDTFKLRGTNSSAWGTYTSGGAAWGSNNASSTARVTRITPSTTAPYSSFEYLAIKTTNSGGSLPEGLEEGGVYGCFRLSTAGYTYLNRLGPAATNELTPLHAVGMGAAGSGTHTATVLHFLEKTTFLPICSGDAQYTTLGVGTRSSDAEDLTAVKAGMAYLKQARGLYPVPADDGTLAYAGSDLDYIKGTANGHLIYDQYEPNTADGPDRGPIHRYHAEYVAAPLTWRRYRNALATTMKGAERRDGFAFDYSTKTIGRWRSGTYPGLGFSTVGKGVNPLTGIGSQPTGCTYAADKVTPYTHARAYGTDFDHSASNQSCGYQLFARPEMLYFLFNRAMHVQNSLTQLSGREFSFPDSGSPVSYEGIFFMIGGGGARASAWAFRDFFQLFWTCPGDHPARALLDDSMTDHLSLIAAMHTNADANFDRTGFSPPMRVHAASTLARSQAFGKPFMASYFDLVCKHVMGAMSDWEDFSAATALFDNFPTQYGSATAAAAMIQSWGSFDTRPKANWVWNGSSWSFNADAAAPTADGMGIGLEFWHAPTWDFGTNTLTFTLDSTGWRGSTGFQARPSAITNGDKIRFVIGCENDPGGINGICPPGCSQDTTYYIGDVSGTNPVSFKLYTDEARTSVVTLAGKMVKIGYDNVTQTLHPVSRFADGTERLPIVSSGGATGTVQAIRPWGASPISGGDGNWIYVSDVTGTFADNETIYIRYSGTAQGGSSTTIQLAAGSPNALTAFGSGGTVTITGGTGSGQTRSVVSNSWNNTTKTLTVSSSWTTPPDATSTYDLDLGTALVNGSESTSGVEMSFTGRFAAGIEHFSGLDQPTTVMWLALARFAQLFGGTVDSGLFTEWEDWADAVNGGGEAELRQEQRQFMVDHTAWT